MAWSTSVEPGTPATWWPSRSLWRARMTRSSRKLPSEKSGCWRTSNPQTSSIWSKFSGENESFTSCSSSATTQFSTSWRNIRKEFPWLSPRSPPVRTVSLNYRFADWLPVSGLQLQEISETAELSAVSDISWLADSWTRRLCRVSSGRPCRPSTSVTSTTVSTGTSSRRTSWSPR